MTAPDLSLTGRLHAVRAALAAHVGETTGEPPAGVGRDGLAHLVERCGLSPFERDTLVLAAGAELDDEIAALCARVHGDPTWSWASYGLALRVLPDGHWDALDPRAPLRGQALLEHDPRAGGLTVSRLRVDERVLLALLGLDSVDEELIEHAVVLEPDAGLLPELHARHLAALAAASGPVVLRGASDAREALVRALAHALGAPRAWQLSALALPEEAARLASLVRRAARERLLTSSPVVLTLDDAEPGELVSARRFAHRLAAAGVPVIASSPDPVSGLPPAVHVVDLDPLAMTDHVEVWRRALGPAAATLNGHLDRLAGQFRLPGDELRAVADQVDAGAPDDPAGPDALAGRLWSACRTRSRADLDGLAERIVPEARWSDLVLPERELSALRDVLRHARHRSTVFEAWQVNGSSRRGAGVTALFAGPSGTGKSLAAEVVAGELEVDVYRVDLSQIVSKYIGETEKNLRRVTDAAERSGAVLVIDEADALFGQRSEVRDSHDRYANVEVSYLLQRMETYRGLAVLTTNLRSNVDDAFVRRLGFILTFPFPDTDARRSLWERAFGPRVPVGDLDHARLAQLMLTGGSIRNVAVHAAFRAAERGDAVTMADLRSSAAREYDKLERPLTPTELAGWSR